MQPRQGLHSRSVFVPNHGKKKTLGCLLCTWPCKLERRADARDLQLGKPFCEFSPLRRYIEQALTPVRLARLLDDELFVDKLLEDAAQALLRDLQDVEEIGDAQARIAVDEVHNPMMRTAEAIALQHEIGVAGEIAIGEEQKLYERGETLTLTV